MRRRDREPWWYRYDDWLERLGKNAAAVGVSAGGVGLAWHMDYTTGAASVAPVLFWLWIVLCVAFGLLALLGVVLSLFAMGLRRRDLRRGWYRQYWNGTMR